MPLGFTLPFAQTTGSVGFFEFTSDEFSAVEQNIRSLLVTNWGERVMHYNFGCNLREFLFEQRNRELRERVGDRVLSQVSTWLPFVTVDELNVLFSEDDSSLPENAMAVRMKFRLTSRPDLSSLFQLVVTP